MKYYKLQVDVQYRWVNTVPYRIKGLLVLMFFVIVTGHFFHGTFNDFRAYLTSPRLRRAAPKYTPKYLTVFFLQPVKKKEENKTKNKVNCIALLLLYRPVFAFADQFRQFFGFAGL